MFRLFCLAIQLTPDEAQSCRVPALAVPGLAGVTVPVIAKNEAIFVCSLRTSNWFVAWPVYVQ